MEKEKYVPINYASFWRRLAAVIIDGLIIGGINLILIKVIGLTAMTLLLGLFIDFSYEIFLVNLDGMTLGKRFLKIRVLSVTGERLTLKQASIRKFTKILSDFIILIGYLWMFLRDDKQTWHDIFARTIVIYRVNEDIAIDEIKKYPWYKGENFDRNRRLALILTTLILFGTTINTLVNKIGLFGLDKTYSINLKGLVKKIRFYDANDDGKKDILALSSIGDKRVLDVYEFNDDIVKTKKYIIENLQQNNEDFTFVKFEVDDIDNDGLLELVTLTKEKSNNILTLYKENNDVFKLIDFKIDEENTNNDITGSRMGIKRNYSDFEIIEDSNEKSIVWIYETGTNPRLHSYSLKHNELVENFFDIVEEWGDLIQGDFDGDGAREVLLLQVNSNSIQVNSLELGKQQTEINRVGEITDWAKVANSIENYGEIKISDFNSDGKDDIILLSKTGRGLSYRSGNDSKDPWIKVFTLDNDKWKNIWSGGNFNNKSLYKGYEYQGNLNIDEDREKEIIITNDNIDKEYFYDRDNSRSYSTLEIYKIAPIKFNINKFWQKIWYFQ